MNFLKKNQLFEIFVILLLVFFSCFILNFFQNYSFFENENLLILHTFIAISPILFTYILFRIFFSSISSLLICLGLFLTLSKVNNIKQSLTQEPLGWSDLSTTSNISIIFQYLNIFSLALILALIFIFIKYKQFTLPSNKKILFITFILILLFPFPFHIYLNKISENLDHSFKNKINFLYLSWNWPGNVEKSGLPMHLIQTSRREIPNISTKDETKIFQSLKKIETNILESKPQNIIFILCEACWNNKDHFYTEFDALRKLNFHEFRSISSIYGGGTVNSSFELITGLPSKGALTGVIYQEYASLFKETVDSYPNSLRNENYKTISVHNFYEGFWKRKLIAPKLGFERFIGLEQMSFTGTGWPEDHYLYDKVINLLKENNEPSFYFLTTVYTHGPYVSINSDTGEQDYKNRLSKSIEDMSIFIEEALKIEPNTAILIVGDHKPAMSEYFLNNQIFPRNFFDSIGNEQNEFKFSQNLPQEIVGDVPGFFYFPNHTKSLKFSQEINGKPLFCISNYFDENFTHVTLPSFNYSRLNKICTSFKKDDYLNTVTKFPSYLYRLSLFD